MANLKFVLVEPTDAQIRDLYNNLQSRTHNISHEEMPTYPQHCAFVVSQPYRYWYLAYDADMLVGSFYIKYDNSIGLNFEIISYEYINECIEYILKNFRPMPAKASFVSKNFYINIASKNIELCRIFDKLGLKEFQVSYCLG